MEQAFVSQSVLHLLVYFVNFSVLFWALQAVQWQYLFRKNSSSQILIAQTLVSMGLAYMSTQFLLALFYSGQTIMNSQF
ncbi:MAG: DUF1146 family protein [Culicoidibacterales bacterium]